MSEAVRINTLEIENANRITAFSADLTGQALTVIGGKNRTGKTSILNAIAFALGGEKFRPDDLHRDGADSPPSIKLTLSNGLTVERTGKNSTLKVTDPSGMKGGQQLLNAFVSTFALDLPKFRDASAKEKAKVLLRVIGVGDELAEIEAEEKRVYAERTQSGTLATSMEANANLLPMHEGVPNEPVSVAELVEQARKMDASNRDRESRVSRMEDVASNGLDCAEAIVTAKAELEVLEKRYTALRDEYADAKAALARMPKLDTSSVAERIASAEDTNAKVRANQTKAKALDEATTKRQAHAVLDRELTTIRESKAALLEGADLPLPGLSVDDGELTYNGKHWGAMSGADQLLVSRAIVERETPECGFVLIDKTEEMDDDTLADFRADCESDGRQVVATRVSVGKECTLILEDGKVKEQGND